MNVFNRLIDRVAKFIGNISWAPSNLLQEEELHQLHTLLAANYFIILTRSNNHFSTYAIGLADFLMRGKFGYWGHSLMNLEDEVNNPDDFRLIEATGIGVNYVPFGKVFSTNSVVLLKPKCMSLEKWVAVMDRAKTNLGKPYDTLFDLSNDKALSCVELVRCALMAEQDYYDNFASFENMIRKYKNLTPSMFYDCPDFEVVFEIKR